MSPRAGPSSNSVKICPVKMGPGRGPPRPNRGQGSSWRAALVPLSLSCLAAVGISFFGWRCRDICSATGFTLLGVANKLLSTLASALLTGQPLSHAGGMCLVGCLFFAAQYRPAPPVAAVEERDRKTKQG